MKRSNDAAGRVFAPLLLLTAATGSLHGSEMPSGSLDDSERILETVVVTATRVESSLMDVAEAVSVVDASEIRGQAPDVLAEMLRGVPGTFFQQTTPGQGIPIIRGLKGSQVLHLVDGMRLNNAFFRNAPNQYLGLVDAYATERVEVVRGSAPSLYGADAMGGVVQVLTRGPSYSDQGWRAGGHLYGSYDSVDGGWVSRAEGELSGERSALFAGFTVQDRGNRQTGSGETIRPSGYEARSADIKYLQRLGENSELMLSAQTLEQPKSPRVDELVPGFGQDQPSSEQYWFKPNRRDFLHARYRLDGDSRWFSRMELHAARQVITDDRLTQDFGETTITEERSDSTLDGLTLQFNSPWGRNSNELVWGAEYYSDAVDSTRFRSDPESGGTSEVRGRYPDGSEMVSAAVYASNRWNLDRLTVDAGLRYSTFTIRLPPTDEMEAVRLTPSDFTGDIHMNYDLAPDTRLVANVGRGFRPPNIFDIGTLGSRPGNRFNVPNPALKPESVWSYDLGVRHSGANWELEAFAWYADYRDRISSRFTGELNPEGRQVVQSDNLDKATLYGIESGLRYIAGEHLQWYAVLNYTRGEETDSTGTSGPADRIPPLNGRLGMVFHPLDSLRIEPWIDFASDQDRLSSRDEDDPRIDPDGTDGWATLNVHLVWEPTDRYTFGLRLENLADEAYREHGSGIDAPGRNIGGWFNLVF